MSEKISKAWTFKSSSGTKRYQTLQYADGTTSCDCPGWTRRAGVNNERSCKHTRSVLMGQADAEALSKMDYGVPVAVAAPTKDAGSAGDSFGTAKRKIRT